MEQAYPSSSSSDRAAAVQESPFDEIIEYFTQREPRGTDTWNPLTIDEEFWHRLRLFAALKWALPKCGTTMSEARILDVGCGVGRSTRALIEFGAKPENLVGIDLRESAIEYAQSRNPAIPYRVVHGLDDWPPAGSFDICTQCTVFSSIRGVESRRSVAAMMERAVIDGGHIFWWDSLRANPIAGGDTLSPEALFENSKIVDSETVPLRPSLYEAIRFNGRRVSYVSKLIQRVVGFSATHRATLFRKEANGSVGSGSLVGGSGLVAGETEEAGSPR